MGRSCLLGVFLVTSFLILSSSHGCGRKLMKSYESEEYATVVLEGSGRRDDSREMMELDYEYAGPNNNPKSGLLFPPPPLAPTPTP